MAEESVAEEMADLGSGVSEQASCTSVIVAFFILNSILLYFIFRILT